MGKFSPTFIKDHFNTLIVMVLVNIKGLILFPILIKSLGTTVYGGYVLSVLTLSFLFGISAFGVGFRYRRYLPGLKSPEDKIQLFFPQFYFQIASISLISLVAMGVWFFIGPRIESVHLNMGIIPLYLFSHVLQVQCTEYFRYTHRLAVHNNTNLYIIYATIGVYLMMVFLGFNLTINKLLMIESVIIFIFCFKLMAGIYKEIGIQFIIYNVEQCLSDIKLGFPIVLNYVMNLLLSSSDRYIVAAFISVTALGIYNPAYTLGAVIMFIPQITGVVLPQLLSKSVDEENAAQAQEMVNYSIKGLLLLTIPYTVGSLVLADDILMLLANKEVASQGHYVTPLVSLGIIFFGLTKILSYIFYVRLDTLRLLKINLLAGILNVGLNIILLSLIKSIVIAALTTLISYFTVFIYAYMKVKGQWKFNLSIRFLASTIVSAFMMGLILFWFEKNFQSNSLVIALIQKIIVAAVIYFPLVFFTGGITQEEFSKIVEKIKRFMRMENA